MSSPALLRAIACTTLAMGLSALVGCANARTEVIVSVNTDIPTVDSLHIDVTDPVGTTRPSTAMLGGGAPPLPRTLGVVWNGGSLGPFVVRAAGLSAGAETVARVADFSFQRGRTLVLRLDLLARCVGVNCPGGQTCDTSGCRSISVTPSELTPYTPGVVTGTDGGSGDGGCGAVDFATDPLNCGRCGNVCNFAHGTGTCRAGSCLVGACDAGFGDCNGRASDGCESDASSDPVNCGRCGMRCRGGSPMCCMGACRAGC